MSDGVNSPITSDNVHLSPRKRAFVRAMLTEKDVRAAALAAGIAEKTGYRWIRLPPIQAAITEAESAALTEVARGLLRLADAAVETLKDAMATTSPITVSARVRAADLVLSRLLQLREQVELSKGMASIEADLKTLLGEKKR